MISKKYSYFSASSGSLNIAPTACIIVDTPIFKINIIKLESLYPKASKIVIAPLLNREIAFDKRLNHLGAGLLTLLNKFTDIKN